MIDYEYRNCHGVVRTIRQRMNDRHPEAVAFNDDGSWFEVTVRGTLDELPATVYRRVYGNIQGNAVNGYPFVSNSLAPGNYAGIAETTADGSPIIRSKEHARAVAEATGKVYRSD